MREKERKKERGGEKERDGESKLIMHACTYKDKILATPT